MGKNVSRMRGGELCKQLREEHSYRRTITGHTTQADLGIEVGQKLDGSGLKKTGELRDEDNFYGRWAAVPGWLNW